MSRRSAAKRFGVAASTAIKWVDQWHRTGSAAALPRGGDTRSQDMEQHAEEVLALIDETPDLTLEELAQHLKARHGMKASVSMVWRLLDRHGLSLKKNGARQRAASA